MRKDSYDGTRGELPPDLLGAYDQIAALLYHGDVRNDRRIRMDMCTACVESFDWMVRLIADSAFCVADLMPKGEARRMIYSRCGREKGEGDDCKTCIRSVAYTMMIEQKKAKEGAYCGHENLSGLLHNHFQE